MNRMQYTEKLEILHTHTHTHTGVLINNKIENNIYKDRNMMLH